MMILHFLHVLLSSDAVAQGRKILSTVEECGINRFNDPKVFNHKMIRNQFPLSLISLEGC